MSVSIGKNKSQEIRVALQEYKGSKNLDIRTYMADWNGGTEMVATKKGISLKVTEIDKLIAALQQVKAEAQLAQWI